MPKKHYDWKDGYIPSIGAHSLAKHSILRKYVETYIEVLTKNPRMERLRLSLVDGFAGGGIYRLPGAEQKHHPGSPIILMDAAVTAQERINRERAKKLSVETYYYFVEKDPDAAGVLHKVVAEHVDRTGQPMPEILNTPFEGELESIIQRIKTQKGRKHRAIFVLDQYGYAGVRIETIRRIFSELPDAEVFLTLAVGWIASYLSDSSQAADWIGSSLGIDLHASDEEIEEQLIREDGFEQRLRVVQKLLHDIFATRAGARHFTPFFIMSRGSNRPYWFLHLANSTKANDVVKELHWQTQNHFMHYGDAGLDMLAYDPWKDPSYSNQFAFDFGDIAQQRAMAALMAELPRRIRDQHANGISFAALFDILAKTTPATSGMLKECLRSLCIGGELAKSGAHGERRQEATLVHSDDIIRPAMQTRFSFRTEK